MDPKVTEEIFKRLDLIGNKLQVGAGYMWTALLKRIFAEGVMDTTFGVVLLVLAGVIAKRGISIMDEDDEAAVEAWTIAAFVSIFGVFFLNSGILYLLSPEYAAFEKLMTLVK